MTTTEYTAQAALTECTYDHTCPEFEPYNVQRLTHFALGLATEALELQAAIRDHHPIEEQLMELGDICWFSGLASAELGAVPLDHKKFLDSRVAEIFVLCEDFASRIKAGLYYGSPVLKTDPSAEHWKGIAAGIFARAVAAGFRNGHDILKLNIAKLRQRYGDKFSAYDALNRDTSAETRVTVQAGVQAGAKSLGSAASIVLATNADMKLLQGHTKTVMPK